MSEYDEDDVLYKYLQDYENQFEDISIIAALGWTEMGRLPFRIDRLTCSARTDMNHGSQYNNAPLINPVDKQNGDADKPERWVSYPKPNPNARLRLFCFPYAGGGSQIYRNWANLLPPTVELGLILLPGRENRLRERPFSRIAPLVLALSQGIRPHLDKNFAFFGHSMGALIGFELARHLRKSEAISPRHLFVSGRGAPHIPDRGGLTYDLPDDELVGELRRLAGTPGEVLENPELMRLVLPMLRADFEMVQTYAYSDEMPLDCPITAFGGTEDEDITSDDLRAWEEQTKRSFSLHILPGNHFFINSQRPLVLEKLSKEFEQMD